MAVPSKVLLPFACPGVVFIVATVGDRYTLTTAAPPDTRGCPAGLFLASLPPPVDLRTYPTLNPLPANVTPWRLVDSGPMDQIGFDVSPSGQFFVNTAWGAVGQVEYVELT